MGWRADRVRPSPDGDASEGWVGSWMDKVMRKLPQRQPEMAGFCYAGPLLDFLAKMSYVIGNTGMLLTLPAAHSEAEHHSGTLQCTGITSI